MVEVTEATPEAVSREVGQYAVRENMIQFVYGTLTEEEMRNYLINVSNEVAETLSGESIEPDEAFFASIDELMVNLVQLRAEFGN